METIMTIDRFEGDKAILKFGDETLIIPKILLPKESKEGSDVFLQITIDKNNSSQETAKDIINEILRA